MKNSNLYSPGFYQTWEIGSLNSAKAIVPIALELINPKSVLDVGCGIATWLSVFHQSGIEDIIGVDGEYVDTSLLHIPKENFQPFDLTQTLDLGRRFDLVVSMEVAEHIDEKYSDIFVENLARHSDIILFSAAIPWQRAVSHVNEQWQSYWAEKFAKKGYIPVDSIRKKVWNNNEVELWYRQNAIIYVKSELLESHGRLKNEYEDNKEPLLSVVHPDFFTHRSDPRNYYLPDIVKNLPIIIKATLKRKLKRN